VRRHGLVERKKHRVRLGLSALATLSTELALRAPRRALPLVAAYGGAF
jgi:hypothetical protein